MSDTTLGETTRDQRLAAFIREGKEVWRNGVCGREERCGGMEGVGERRGVEKWSVWERGVWRNGVGGRGEEGCGGGGCGRGEGVAGIKGCGYIHTCTCTYASLHVVSSPLIHLQTDRYTSAVRPDNLWAKS